MTLTKLDLTGLKCPMPALRTRKALRRLSPGDRLEVLCTDPLAAIDIPAMVQQSGDLIETTARVGPGVLFLIARRVAPPEREP